MALEFGMGFGRDKDKKQASLIVATDGTGDSDDIGEAIAMLPDGVGSIFVKEGTYEIKTNIQPLLNGLTIFGAGKGTIVNCKVAGIAILLTGSSNVTIRDIKFVGTGSSSALGWVGGSGNTIKDCFFSDFTTAGVWIGGTTIGGIISACEFDDNAIGVYLEALQFGGGNIYCMRIINNYIHDSTGNGINMVQDGTANLDFTIIEGNNIQENGGFGIDINQAGVDRTLIVGNIILNNTSGEINDSGSNTTAANNIIA